MNNKKHTKSIPSLPELPLLKNILSKTSPKYLKLIIAIFLVAVVALCVFFTVKDRSRSSMFMETDALDPYKLLLMLKNRQEITVIDVRSSEEFMKEHIRGAINISLAESIDNALVEERLAGREKNIPVVIYGNTAYSLEPRLLARYLYDKGFKAEPLAVGWNEWRHFVTLWLPESQWDIVSVDDFNESPQK